MSYQSDSGDIRMFLCGDLMPSRRLTCFQEKNYLALVELVRGANVAFANLETPVRHRHEGAADSHQGTPMTADPVLLQDIRWMGFDVVSSANNHVPDYGTDGVAATLRHLDDADIPAAGAGLNLSQARRPAFKDTAAGRVGVVAATSFFRPRTQASDQRPDAAGRPGINPLAFSRSYTVDSTSFAELARVSAELGLTQERARLRKKFFSEREVPADTADELIFLDARFTRSSKFAVRTKVSQEDAEANLRWIKEARRQSDWVIFSFHYHEFGSSGRLTATSEVELDEPADFVVEFARAAIDAGADVVAGHGPHLALGIEIYRGRPIFYSLGNFIFQNETIDVIPAEAYGRFGLTHYSTPSEFFEMRTDGDRKGFPATREYWESFVAVCEFGARKLANIRVYPTDLGFGRPRAARGRPVLATGDTASRILTRLARRSQRYGTVFSVAGEECCVKLA